jgi:hypothetical protein
MPPVSNAVSSLDHKILKELGISEVWQAYIYNILKPFFLTLRRASEDCSPNRDIHSLAVPMGAEVVTIQGTQPLESMSAGYWPLETYEGLKHFWE